MRLDVDDPVVPATSLGHRVVGQCGGGEPIRRVQLAGRMKRAEPIPLRIQ
jgi:hypothetical protein